MRICFLFYTLWLLATPAFCAKSSFVWTQPTAEELQENAPKIEAGAAAEMLLNRVEIDDGNNGSARIYQTRQRYKIYDPSRASSILSLSYWEFVAKDRSLVVEARLVLPSGEVREFNQASFLERTVENKPEAGGILRLLASSREKTTQKYLPIAGVERGSVLEIQMRWTRREEDIPPMDVWVMQFEDIAVRKSEYVHRCQKTGVPANIFALNGAVLDVSDEGKRRVVTASAGDLPPMVAEPFSGPFTDYCELTIIALKHERKVIFRTMDPDELKKKTVSGRTIQKFGRWMPWASAIGYYADEYGKPTGRIKKLASEICEGAETDEAKGRAIHNYVLRLSEKYGRHTEQKKLKAARLQPTALHDILDFERLKRALSAEDFVLLAYALNKAAGLDAALVALPDRSFMRFSPKLNSERLLMDLAIGIYSDGRWYFSSPHTAIPLPFDMLPPPSIGQSALIGQYGEEFVPVPFPPSETTQILLAGDFQLSADGGLSGSGRLSLTGYTAAVLRYVLKDLDDASQKRAVREIFLSEMPPSAFVAVSEIGGLGGIEEPVFATFTLTWEGFATRSDDRLILKPSVFRIAQRSPFTAGTRKAPIVFDFKWRETDRVLLRLPTQFALEAPGAPTPYPHDIFNYDVSIGYSAKSHRLILDRQYTSDCVEAKPVHYPQIRAIHARIQSSDEHEVILKLKPEPIPGAAPAVSAVTF